MDLAESENVKFYDKQCEVMNKWNKIQRGH